VPEDEAPYYAEGLRRGGTLISIQTSDTLRAKDIMNRNGATNIHERVNLWRQAGWKGFNTNPIENEDTPLSPGVMLPATLLDMAVMEDELKNNSPTNAITIVPVVEEEPPLDDEDTAKSLSVPDTVPTTDTETPVHYNSRLMP